MTDPSDFISFECDLCGSPIIIDGDNPPQDDDILSCQGCGRDFGPYGKVKDAIIEMARAELDEMIADTLKGISRT